MYIYIYMYISLSLYIYIYIYTYACDTCTYAAPPAAPPAAPSARAPDPTPSRAGGPPSMAAAMAAPLPFLPPAGCGLGALVAPGARPPPRPRPRDAWRSGAQLLGLASLVQGARSRPAGGGGEQSRIRDPGA